MVVYKVHQMHKTEDSMPAALKVYQETVKLYTPQYEYNFWTDATLDALVDSEFPQYADLYYSLTPKIKRIDMSKYLVIYKYGGFFFDADLELFKDPTPLVQGNAVVLCDPAAFYSEPKHTFWLDMFEHIAKNRHAFVIEASGPAAMKSVYLRTNYADVKYLPQSVFLPLENEPFAWNFWRKDGEDDQGMCKRKYGATSTGCHHGSFSWVTDYLYLIIIPIVVLLILAAVGCFFAYRAVRARYRNLSGGRFEDRAINRSVVQQLLRSQGH
jgi:hypothetical protein